MTQRALSLALLSLLGCGDDRTLGDTIAEAIDPSVEPCRDFYQYACGGWLRAHRQLRTARFGRGFGELSNRNFDELRSILETTEDPNLVQYYAACLDEAAVETTGLAPLLPLFAQIDSVRDLDSLMSAAGTLHASAAPVLFGLYATPALHDPSRTILDIGQGGFGLPDRDFYLTEEEDGLALLADYGQYVGDMLALSGGTSSIAASVIAFETELARTSTPGVVLRAPENTDHPLDLEMLRTLAPLPWQRLFDELGATSLELVNVTTPSHLEAVARLLERTPPETLRAYLRWRTLDAYGAHLPASFVELQDGFAAKIYGPAPKSPRQRLCVTSTNWALRDTLGQAFFARVMPENGFGLAEEILARVESTFVDELGGASWLDPETREGAMAKMQAISKKVASPMPWPEIVDAAPGPEHLTNVLRFASAKAQRYFAKIGTPVDRAEWLIAVPTVNAYYNPHLNEIVFPAAILQPPFYTPESVPLSFGGIGSVMGHELTHALDDQGRKFASDGSLEEWWTPAAIEAFDRRAECVVDQFGAHEIQPGLFVDGRLTLGENIADLGGIELAHRAYLQWRAENGEPDALDGIDELDDEQLLFVAFAQTWCTIISPETERLLALVDVHAPAKLRVNGPLRNLPAFHEAFACELGSPMFPEATCEVW